MTESHHKYERVPGQNHESTYEEAQTYEQIVHCDILPQLQSTLASGQKPEADQCSTISPNHTYERPQTYEKVQTYERLHHCNVSESSLLKHLSSQELTIQESPKSSKHGQGDRSFSQETYEHISCDVPLQLLPQTKLNTEETVTNVEQSTNLHGDHNERVDEAQTRYEQIQHCDILVPIPKLITDSEQINGGNTIV